MKRIEDLDKLVDGKVYLLDDEILIKYFPNSEDYLTFSTYIDKTDWSQYTELINFEDYGDIFEASNEDIALYETLVGGQEGEERVTSRGDFQIFN